MESAGRNYVQSDRLTGERFQQALTEMVETLIKKVPDAGIFLFDTPAPGKDGKEGLTKHCIVTDFKAFTSLSDGKSVIEWLWEGITGQVENVGMHLLQY